MAAMAIRVRESSHFDLSETSCVLKGGMGILLKITSTRKTGSARMEIEAVNVKDNCQDALAALNESIRGRTITVCNFPYVNCIHEEDEVAVAPPLAQPSSEDQDIFPNGINFFTTDDNALLTEVEGNKEKMDIVMDMEEMKDALPTKSPAESPGKEPILNGVKNSERTNPMDMEDAMKAIPKSPVEGPLRRRSIPANHNKSEFCQECFVEGIVTSVLIAITVLLLLP